MILFIIGTNKKSAKQFFNILKKNNVKGIIDIRLNNSSQLNEFSKSKDLEFFLKKILNLDYQHLIELAPTKDILKRYKNKTINWKDYERDFKNLMIERNVKKKLTLKTLKIIVFYVVKKQQNNVTEG